MKSLPLILIIFAILSHLPIQAQKADERSAFLLNKLIEVNGGFEKLLKAEDVQFTHTKVVYGNRRESKEKLIFKGEHSLSVYKGEYKGRQGIIKRSNIGGRGAMSIDDELLTDTQVEKIAVRANNITFYRFSMMYKLSDPSTIATYAGRERIGEISYDKVKLIFDYNKSDKKAHDEYLLYFNPETHLVDLFLYSETNGDVLKAPKAKVLVTYKLIQDIYVPIIRKHMKLNKNKEWQVYGVYSFSDVRFTNGYTAEDFEL